MLKYALLFMLIGGFGTFYWTSQSFKQDEQQESQATQHSSTWVDETTGKLHVMGIVLNQSTVRDAEVALRSRAQSAIFLHEEKAADNKKSFRLSMEAYFPSIADHSKVMLVLNIDEALLIKMSERGTPPRVYPNGIVRINPSDQDILAAQKMTIKELRLVPSVQLDSTMLEGRFGKPDSIKKNEDGSIHYYYPAIGLDALIKPEDKDILSFAASRIGKR